MQDQLDRLHFMDAMRGTLMILGVVLHSAEVFNPEQIWVIYSENTNRFLGYLVGIIETFRMPAFFVVSGYFCYLTLQKYKVKKFLRVRIERIFVPLVVTALTLNLLQSLFLQAIGRRAPLYDYVTDGQYIAHLWFLVNILAYFLVACLLAVLLKPFAGTIRTWTAKLFNNVPMLLIVFLMPFFSVAVMATTKVGFPLYYMGYGFLNVWFILMFAPFFFFGVIIAFEKDYLKRFSSINPILCLAVAIAAFLLLEILDPSESKISEIAYLYTTALKQWASVLICFYIFFRFLNNHSKAGQLLSESSYSVYLLHHFFVVVLAALLIKYNVPAFPGVLTLIAVVSIITLTIHFQLIAKNKWLLYAFNGKK